MLKSTTSFLLALLASGCTLTVTTLPLALLPAEENAENLSEAAVLTLAGGVAASLVVGGVTLAYAENRRTRQQGQHLHQQIEELESTLQDKNEKLVALALQTLAGSPALDPSQLPDAKAPEANPDQPQPSDPAQPLQTLLAWTTTTPMLTSEQGVEETPAILPPEVVVASSAFAQATPNLTPSETPEVLLDPLLTDITHASQIFPEVAALSAQQPIPTVSEPDHRPWQVQLILQQAKLEELESQLREHRQARHSLEDRLASSLAREQSLRSQLEAQSERLMTLEAFQTQVKQQQQQIRQLHAALHKMKHQMVEKNKLLGQLAEQHQELNNAKAALKGYHAVVKQNQDLQAALQSLQVKLPSPEEMNRIYGLVQRQRQRIQRLESTLQGIQQQRRQVLHPEIDPAESEDYPPKWRDLLRENEFYSS